MAEVLLKGGSQNNEDDIIQVIFDKLNISQGSYLEIGVNNYTPDRSIQCNSIKLINKGWTGSLFDANFQHPLVKNILVSTDNVNELIDTQGAKIDFFSIDIDSYDWYIVKEILQKKNFHQSFKSSIIKTLNILLRIIFLNPQNIEDGVSQH